jgi:uncharacterized protein (DUF305 family)
MNKGISVIMLAIAGVTFVSCGGSGTSMGGGMDTASHPKLIMIAIDIGDSQQKEIDQMFASMMIDHHNGAIAMARMALQRAQHPEIKALAHAIIAAQEREVQIMEPFAKKSGAQTMTGMSMG